MRSFNASSSQALRPSFLLLVILGVLLALPGSGWAQTVSLQIQVIHASNQPGGVDSRLGNLAEDLRKTFRYSTYQLLDAPKGSAALNQTWSTTLPDNRVLEITPTTVQKGQFSLTVHVHGPGGKSLVNTVVRLRGGSTVLLGGSAYKQGVLIIAISAS